MPPILLWLAVAAGLAGITAGDGAAGTCPADSPRAQRIVERFLANPSIADVRQQHGLAAVRAASVRVLTDAQDLAACQKLAADLRFEPVKYPLDAHYYAADGFYFVVGLHQVPDDRIYIGHVPLTVLDGSFQPVGHFAQ